MDSTSTNYYIYSFIYFPDHLISFEVKGTGAGRAYPGALGLRQRPTLDRHQHTTVYVTQILLFCYFFTRF